MKLTPAFRSCLPMFHEKSSRNWNLCWVVVCGVLTLWPTVTRFGWSSVGTFALAALWLYRREDGKTNSFSFPPESALLRFRFAEWNLLLLTPQFSGGEVGLAP